MRLSDGRFQWACGKPVAEKTLQYMVDAGVIVPSGDELLGDKSMSQTWRLASA